MYFLNNFSAWCTFHWRSSLTNFAHSLKLVATLNGHKENERGLIIFIIIFFALLLFKYFLEGQRGVLCQSDLIRAQTVHQAVLIWYLQEEEFRVVIDRFKQLMLTLFPVNLTISTCLSLLQDSPFFNLLRDIDDLLFSLFFFEL